MTRARDKARFQDLNGTEFILDADGDTSITADTDDQIDVRIGGADDFAFKANTFEVQTGSNIDMNGTELILDADGDTSITADTDDQIDIKIANADDFKFTANNFNVLSGSTLTIDSGATITNSGTANGFGGKVKQIVSASDNTLYSISVTNSTSDHAGSIAYSITPTSTDHKIKIDFFIPQIRHQADTAGLRVRLYRQIGSGGYSHVTGLSGTASSNKQAAMAGNYDNGGDGNRSTLCLGGTVVDSPSTTSQVDYKFYFGSGDGSTTIFVNRTQNDADSSFTNRTRTHVTLTEFE